MLINNAGVVSGRALLDTPDHLIERSFNVNVLAHFWVSVTVCHTIASGFAVQCEHRIGTGIETAISFMQLMNRVHSR